MKKIRSVLSLLEYKDGCWYAVYPSTNVKIHCTDQYRAYIKQLEILDKDPNRDSYIQPSSNTKIEKYNITLSYNELEDCSVEVCPTVLKQGQTSTLTIDAPNDVEWNATASNAILVGGPTYSTGKSILSVAKVRGNITINVPFEKEISDKTITYNATQEITGEWVENNTYIERNTWDPESEKGVLYMNEEFESITDTNNPFYSNSTVTSVNLSNSQLTDIGDYAFAFKPSLRDNEEEIGWMTKDVNNGLTFIDYDETFTIYDDGGPDEKHGKSINVVHTLIVPEGMRIRIHFNSFALGSGDHLKAYNGEVVSASTLSRDAYGHSYPLPEDFVSDTNIYTLEYKTTKNMPRAGFDATVSVINDTGIIPPKPKFRPYQSNLKSIILPDTLTSISDSCFENCKNLTSVSLPDNLISIGKNCFKNCNRLTSIVLPDSVTTVGESAFSICNNLMYVKLSNNLTAINKEMFKKCNNLVEITIPSSVTNIGKNAFYMCDNLTSVKILCNSSVIGSGAFYMCTNLTSVKISNGITKIDSNAFSNCTNLTSIIIPGSVTSIGDNAFTKCSNLTNIVLSEGIVTIGKDAFYFCSNLTSITLPSTIEEVCLYFSGCKKLTSITCLAIEPPTLTTYNISNYTIYVPSEALIAYRRNWDWKHAKEILPISE